MLPRWRPLPVTGSGGGAGIRKPAGGAGADALATELAAGDVPGRECRRDRGRGAAMPVSTGSGERG